MVWAKYPLLKWDCDPSPFGKLPDAKDDGPFAMESEGTPSILPPSQKKVHMSLYQTYLGLLLGWGWYRRGYLRSP